MHAQTMKFTGKEASEQAGDPGSYNADGKFNTHPVRPPPIQ
jgi:hypothetical protein